MSANKQPSEPTAPSGHRSTTLWLAMIGFGICYSLTALITIRTSGFGEVYPFFPWTVFEQTPLREQITYDILVSEYGDARFEPPRFLKTIPGLRYSQTMTFPGVFQHIQHLGRALKAGRPEEANRIKERVDMLFGGTPAKYFLVKVSFDPIDRWRTGAVRSLETLAALQSISR